MPTNKNRLLDAALSLARSSRSVIPISKELKEPYIRWQKYQDEIASEDEIKIWWRQFPQANLGVITGRLSNLTVVECDSSDAILIFLQKFPKVEETLQVKPGRIAARQFYFEYETGIQSGRTTIHWKIDVRSEGQ
jgi:Bifunctional DNA primase/polymerase, N-terminal